MPMEAHESSWNVIESNQIHKFGHSQKVKVGYIWSYKGIEDNIS